MTNGQSFLGIEVGLLDIKLLTIVVVLILFLLLVQIMVGPDRGKQDDVSHVIRDMNAV